MTRSLSREAAVAHIAGLREDLDAALDEIDALRRAGEIGADHQSYLNDYAAVRIAGYLEQLCFHAISGRMGELASGPPQEFINSWFHKSPNLTAGQFRDLFKRFGTSTDERVKDFLDDGLHRDLLDRLLETRNAVAHGKEYQRTGLQSLETFRTLLDEIQSFVEGLLLIDQSHI